MMPITINDPGLVEQIKAAGEEVVFTDTQGNEIARYTQLPLFAPPPELMDLCKSEEQLAAARATGPGRSFREVLAELKARRACTK